MNIYTKKARSIAEYAMMRGVTDFSNAAQFNMYESGYSHLCIISKPKFLEMLAEEDKDVEQLLKVFCYILEYEFKGLDGIEDITTESLEFSDGISTINTIGKVNKQSASEISMTFTEKSGAVITNFLKYYLTGLKDPRTQAKTYHGLIRRGKLAAGFENEVFNLLYIVMDNTMLGLEKSYLLCNAWPTKSPTNIYNSEKGSIEKKDVEVSWQCFVLDGPEIDQRALKVLAFINEEGAVYNAVNAIEQDANANLTKVASTIKSQTSNSEGVINLESERDYGTDTLAGSSTFGNRVNNTSADSDLIYSSTSKIDDYVSNTGATV